MRRQSTFQSSLMSWSKNRIIVTTRGKDRSGANFLAGVEIQRAINCPYPDEIEPFEIDRSEAEALIKMLQELLK